MITPERQARLRQVLDQRQPDLTVLMDQVHKPHNLAAIMRTCDAVGILEMHAVPVADTVRIKHNKAASGAQKWIPVHRHASVAQGYDALHRDGHQILVAHFTESARDYRQIDYTRPTALVVGAELEGLSDQAVASADTAVTIPMRGMTQSLNVSVATALILYEAMRQREAIGGYQQASLSPSTYDEWFNCWAER